MSGDKRGQEANHQEPTLYEDPQVVAAEYVQHFAAVREVAFHITHDPALAAEIAHEVFVHAWSHPNEHDPKRSSRLTWLRMHAKYGALNRLRTLQRIKGHEESLEAPTEDDEQSSDLRFDLQDPRTSVDGFDNDLIAQEGVARLLEHIARLPEGMRGLFIARYVNGLSPQELMDATNLTRSTIATRLYRAKGLLEAMLAAETDQPA